jgi:hypothetical protein
MWCWLAARLAVPPERLSGQASGDNKTPRRGQGGAADRLEARPVQKQKGRN